MKLYIDSSDNLKTMIKLDNNKYVKSYKNPREQDVMGVIVSALKEEGKKVEDIDRIEVNVGPGSFTGLRVGVSIASAFSFALGVRINNKLPGTIIEPSYGKKPNVFIVRKEVK